MSSLSFPDSKSKTLLVSRAFSLFKTGTTSVASKSAVAAIMVSKPAQLQNTPLLVLLASKLKPKAKANTQ